jgi:ParB family chromosome partitioning protein
VAEIRPNPNNPRRRLGGITELAESLNAHGLLQPIVLRTANGGYEIVAGHRRYEAARQLGWERVPAVIRDTADDSYLLALVENLQRQDLRPREEAAALEVLVRERGWTTRQVAAAINRSQAYVSKRLRVFEDPILAPAVLMQQLSVSAAEELLVIDEKLRYQVLNEAIDKKWERAQIREAGRQARFAANRAQPRATRGLARRLREVRRALQGVSPASLTDAERRELRLLFIDLSVLAKAPSEPRAVVFPPLPAC